MFQEESNIIHLRFPQKLWYLSNSNSDAIIWGSLGRSILLNYNVLGGYLSCNRSIFKTTHISSFIRQLNLYGFRKVTSHLQDPLCNSSNPDLHEYMHDFFQYGKIELLNNIKRKTWNLKKYCNITVSKYTHHSLKINRSFGSLRLRKARKALQDALKKATLQHGRILYNEENNDDAVMKIEYKILGGDDMIPISWSKKSPQCFLPSKGSFVQSPFSQVSYSQDSTLPSQEFREEMNLSTYIGNFSVSEDMPSSTMEENYQIAAHVSEDDYILPSEEPVQPVDYKSFLNNNNTVLVEVLDHRDQHFTTEQTAEQIEWNQINNDVIFTKNEIFFNRSDDVIKMEENPLPDQEFEDACKSKDESYTDAFGETWEYKEILKDMITKKNFPEQEYGTELKEIYTQISQTIDLLNS